jgi:hypothetical protein
MEYPIINVFYYRSQTSKQTTARTNEFIGDIEFDAANLDVARAQMYGIIDMQLENLGLDLNSVRMREHHLPELVD